MLCRRRSGLRARTVEVRQWLMREKCARPQFSLSPPGAPGNSDRPGAFASHGSLLGEYCPRSAPLGVSCCGPQPSMVPLPSAWGFRSCLFFGLMSVVSHSSFFWNAPCPCARWFGHVAEMLRPSRKAARILRPSQKTLQLCRTLNSGAVMSRDMEKILRHSGRVTGFLPCRGHAAGPGRGIAAFLRYGEMPCRGHVANMPVLLLISPTCD
jgi:hypothetical protein